MSENKTQKNPSHGGKRQGAGRKSCYDIPMASVRVPIPLKEEVLKLRELYKHQVRCTVLPITVMTPATNPSFQPAPLYATPIPAGFPSPADDYVERRLDLNEYFIHSPTSTFFLRAIGDSMDLAGILEGSIIQVDRSLTPQHRDIVIAAIDGEFTVKRYVVRGDGLVALSPESSNKSHKPIICYHDTDVTIFGVVNAIHHKLR
jgi:DNA polymerase V